MQGAIRAQEMPPPNAGDSGFFSRSAGSRSFLRYGYGDLLAKERKHTVLHRIWPGTQRVLCGGIRKSRRLTGRVAGFCGSNGVEILEPLSFKGRKGSGLPGGRNGYAEAALKLEFDFEKYEYSYRVWGRNLYNPDTDADGWKRLLRKEFAGGAEQAGLALSAAEVFAVVTTAHCPSAANNLYWPEMYWDMQMTEAGRRNPYSDTPAPRRFGTVSSLDPEFFLTCDELAEELAQGKSSGKYSPLWVAARLDECAEQAGAALRKPKPAAKPSPEFRRWQTDAAIQAGLGRFYAAKFRSGANYSLYLKTKEPAALREALREGQASRASWRKLADAARGVYAADVTYGPDYYQRGHWTDRVDAMNEDLADLEKLVAQVPAPGVESAAWKPDAPPAFFSMVTSSGSSEVSSWCSTSTRPPSRTKSRSRSRWSAIALVTQSGPIIRHLAPASAAASRESIGWTGQPSFSRQGRIAFLGSNTRTGSFTAALGKDSAIGQTSSTRSSRAHLVPSFHNSMFSVNRVRSLTCGTSKATRSRLRKDVSDWAWISPWRTVFPDRIEQAPSELQFAGQILVVEDVEPPVEFGRRIAANLLLGHAERHERVSPRRRSCSQYTATGDGLVHVAGLRPGTSWSMPCRESR